MTAFFNQAASYIWGTPMVLLLIIANIILLFHSKLIPIKGIRHSLQLLRGKHHDKTKKEEGQINHFQALCNAMSATIGLGNISGVAVAIYQGGAGAIFWMWVTALLGMNTKFFECTLAIMFRGRDYQGEVQGGPMYYIESGLGEKYKPLGIFFAICGLVGTLSLFSINQLTSYIEHAYSVDMWISGIFFAGITAYILMGGLQRLTKISTTVVPFMGICYIFMCLFILLINYELVPIVFKNIFVEAFTGKAAVGGVLGLTVKEIMQIGIKRASFSNEAGLGTAPMAHSNTKTNEPVSVGYVAMLEPFIDTIIICTMTALVILIGQYDGAAELNGIKMTSEVFSRYLGEFGKHGLGLMILLFAFTTLTGISNYNRKCWNYLFKGKFIFNDKCYIFYYCSTLILGSLIQVGVVVDIIDSFYGLMVFPNIIAVVLLAPKVNKELKKYNEKYKI